MNEPKILAAWRELTTRAQWMCTIVVNNAQSDREIAEARYWASVAVRANDRYVEAMKADHPRLVAEYSSQLGKLWERWGDSGIEVRATDVYGNEIQLSENERERLVGLVHSIEAGTFP